MGAPASCLSSSRAPGRLECAAPAGHAPSRLRGKVDRPTKNPALRLGFYRMTGRSRPTSTYAALIAAYRVARLTPYSSASAVLLSVAARWRIVVTWSALSLAERSEERR